MKHKRKLLAHIMYYTGLSRLGLMAVSRLAPGLRILAYHRIYDIPSNKEFEPDIELISASTEQFKWQMGVVKSYFQATTFDEVLRMIENNEPIPSNAIIVTFDDGYADNYFNAFPILKEYNIPATIFLASGYIDGCDPFWYDWISIALSRAEPQSLELDQIGLTLTLGQSQQERRRSCEILLAKLKRVPNSTRINVIDELTRILGIDRNIELDEYSRPLSWAQVSEMQQAGIQIGGHSVTHAVLTTLDSGSLESEVVGCYRQIQEHLSIDPLVFSYPVGGVMDVNEKVIEQVRSAGFKMAVSYIDGYNDSLNLQQFQMRRIHVERYLSKSEFCALLALPRVFST